MITQPKFSDPAALLADGAKPLTVNSLNVDMVVKALTSMYSLASFSAFREYFTNGIEATRLAGSLRPMEVTLPCESNNWTLTIKDFGPGMSEKEIDEIFRQYTATTKNKSNNFIGGFGLGSKTGLAYAPQFDVVSVKDGVKVKFYLSRVDETGAAAMPHLQTVSVEKTDESNGMTVILPYKKGDFKAKFLTSIAGFPKNEYVITNPAVAGDQHLTVDSSTHYEVKSITDTPLGWVRYVNSANKPYSSPDKNQKSEFYLDRTNYVVNIWVNVGGVLYNVPVSRIPQLSGKFLSFLKSEKDRTQTKEVILNVPIGTLDFISSRDDFDYTENTQISIAYIADELINNFPATMEEKINELTEPSEIIKFAQTWNPLVGVLSYQGEEVGVYYTADYLNADGIGTVCYEKTRKRLYTGLTELEPKVKDTKTLYVKESAGELSGLEGLLKIKFHLSVIQETFRVSGVTVVPASIYHNSWFQKVANMNSDVQTVSKLIETVKEERRKKQRRESVKADKVSGTTIYSKVVKSEKNGFVIAPLLAEELTSEKIVYTGQSGSYGINVNYKIPYMEQVLREYWDALDGYTVVALTARQSVDVFLQKAPNAVHIRELIYPQVKKDVSETKAWSLRVALANTHYGGHNFSIYYAQKLVKGYDELIAHGLDPVAELDGVKESFEMPDHYSRFSGYKLDLVDKKVLEATAEKWLPILRKYRPLHLMLNTDDQLDAIVASPAYFEAVKTLIKELNKE